MRFHLPHRFKSARELTRRSHLTISIRLRVFQLKKTPRGRAETCACPWWNRTRCRPSRAAPEEQHTHKYSHRVHSPAADPLGLENPYRKQARRSQEHHPRWIFGVSAGPAVERPTRRVRRSVAISSRVFFFSLIFLLSRRNESERERARERANARSEARSVRNT